VDGLQGLASHRLKIYCFNKINVLVFHFIDMRGFRGLCVCCWFCLKFTLMTDVNIYCVADSTASCQTVILTEMTDVMLW